MSGNQEKLHDFVPFNGGKVTFGSGEGRITGKGSIRTLKVDFEDVYCVKELQNFNLFSVSQICDKKIPVLFTEEDCLILSQDLKMPDESLVLLRVPRNHNLYTFNLNDVKPEGDLACLVAKASLDESTKWHRRMAHVNFKVINKLSKNGLVHGLPSKIFTNEHNCVACNNGKQHKASYKTITAVSTISEPLQLLHMDLFGPTSIRSIDHKYFCLVITDAYSRFSWVFSLGTKDQTFQILARLQKQEHAANEEAKRLGLEFAQDTEALLRQAALDASRNPISADGSPVAADANTPDGISAIVPVSTATSTSLDEPFTRFPSPSDLGNHEQSTGIFQSASYDDDFAPTLTNLETSVDVNPIPTKRINTIHPLIDVLGDPSAMVQTIGDV